MKSTLNRFRLYSKPLAITSPILSILILGGAIALIPNPTADKDFFYLFAAIVCIALLALIGLISARMVIKDSASRVVTTLSVAAIGLDLLILFLNAIFFIIVGLVGATSS